MNQDILAAVGNAGVARHIQPGTKPIPGVANVIAIASGKGGVGKSTSAVNLAVALAAMGVRVGLLDADIYGPNVPAMLGLSAVRAPDARTPYKVQQAHGVASMSIAFLIDVDTPMVWRGPMASRAVQQLAFDSSWPELDILLVDLPPGTGDIPLTITQKLPLSGALVVTTPQNIATLDAKKGVMMLQKVSIPVLGVLENMSYHICSACGHESALFATGGGEQLAQQHAIPVLAKIPLQQIVREAADSGNPVVLQDEKFADLYKQAAQHLLLQLSLRPKSYAAKFPEIVVE